LSTTCLGNVRLHSCELREASRSNMAGTDVAWLFLEPRDSLTRPAKSLMRSTNTNYQLHRVAMNVVRALRPISFRALSELKTFMGTHKAYTNIGKLMSGRPMP